MLHSRIRKWRPLEVASRNYACCSYSFVSPALPQHPLNQKLHPELDWMTLRIRNLSGLIEGLTRASDTVATPTPELDALLVQLHELRSRSNGQESHVIQITTRQSSPVDNSIAHEEQDTTMGSPGTASSPRKREQLVQPTGQRASKRPRNSVPLAGAHPSIIAGTSFGALTDANDDIPADDVDDSKPADKTSYVIDPANDFDDAKRADQPPAGITFEVPVVAPSASNADWARGRVVGP